MLPVRFDDITADHILRLVADKIAEHKTLEYKETLSLGNQEKNAEFLADISSFANASGGDIIFGVSDERDENGKATGIPAKIVPLQMGNPASECARSAYRVMSLSPRSSRYNADGYLLASKEMASVVIE